MGAQWTKDEDDALIAWVKQTDENGVSRYDSAIAYSRIVGNKRYVGAYHSRMGMLARAGLIPAAGRNTRKGRKPASQAVDEIADIILHGQLPASVTLQKIREVLLYA